MPEAVKPVCRHGDNGDNGDMLDVGPGVAAQPAFLEEEEPFAGRFPEKTEKDRLFSEEASETLKRCCTL